MSSPLADRLRPSALEDVVGQTHLLGAGRPLKRIIDSGSIPNLIFYGPSGVGKTTVARIIAEATQKRLHKLNGTNASTADIKSIVEELDTFAAMDGVLLYLDEIQYLNKKQQQSLLEYIESGKITLIASTTENPYFYIYNAVLSRCTVFEFKPVPAQEIEQAILRAFHTLEKEQGIAIHLEEGAVGHIALSCGGDVRKALNTAELCAMAGSPEPDGVSISLSLARELAQKSSFRYDRSGDEHYDTISALQKSIRGSDENAALHYLARLVAAGDLISVCRRLLVIASEDIGLAYPQAITIVKSCVDAAQQLGFPEARIPLAQAVVLLATAPKSNSAHIALDLALEDLKTLQNGSIPRTLQNKHFDGDDVEQKGQFYRSPHDYPNHYLEQQYLPEELKGRIYYEYGPNKNEQAAKQYWEKIKGAKSF
ncbi:MAG: replication-associated recombination protein A [Oscillospiraceae bacterium]|nr:replication-associated recombination protein A [Oscillospiraceae bacterium]